MIPNPELERQRLAEQTPYLITQGWIPQNHWLFLGPSGSCHDLSAADLTQLDRIEREKLFLA